MIYLKSVEVIKDQTPLKAGLKIDFNKQITFLVGDNGVGKSTIMDGIFEKFGKKDDTYMKRRSDGFLKFETIDENFPFKGIDFHGDDRKFAGTFGDDFSLQMAQMRASSGQVTLSLLMNAGFKEFKNGLIAMDEPERGLSIRNQWGLAKIIYQLLQSKNAQIIITCHSETILMNFKDSAQYFDVGLKKEVTFKEYMLSQMS